MRILLIFTWESPKRSTIFLKLFSILLRAFTMSIDTIEVRVLLRHYWKKDFSTRKAADAINEVEGEGTVGKTAAAKWFQRFNDGDFNLEDKPRSGRPSVLDEGDLQAALDAEPSSSTRELATELGVDQKTVWNHLQQLDFVHKKPRQDPHELTEAQGLFFLNFFLNFLFFSQQKG